MVCQPCLHLQKIQGVRFLSVAQRAVSPRGRDGRPAQVEARGGGRGGGAHA